MRFSAWLSAASPWDEILAQAHHVEAAGWDGIWIADHFMPNGEDTRAPVGEAWTIVSALAASVPRVRLGTLVTGNTYRHPAVLAKMAAQVDIISGGRLILGLGAGWQENEHEAYGIEFSTVRGRLDRLEEASQVITSLFANEHNSFDGKHYQLHNASLSLKPVQQPLPLLIGGGGERRTLRVAARYANAWNVWGRPETLARKGAVLEQHCEAVGRDPSEIERSANALLQFEEEGGASPADRRPRLAGTVDAIREQVGRYREVGVDEIVIPEPLGGNLEARMAIYDRFIEEVVPEFR